jgi:AraC-like DNA-binding protein
MNNPDQLLNFASRQSESPFVETIWHCQSEQAGEFLSVAATHWEIVIMRLAGKLAITMRGPETYARPAHCPADGEWLGIVFKRGTFMPQLPAIRLVDRDLHLPTASSQSFWLNGSVWEIPSYENADVFVTRMMRAGLLAHDRVVEAALCHHVTDCSLRSVQRRFLRATGLTHGAIAQIERARQATALLRAGHSIGDTIDLAGYADQPHLTRALKRFIGQTPAQLRSPARAAHLSFITQASPAAGTSS